MNTYIFLQLSRKEPPRLEGTIRADTPEEAIKKNKFFPYDPRDWEEYDAETERTTSPEERANEVFAYYGLIKGKDPWDYGNGPDGYGTTLVEVSDDDDQTTKTYPSPYPDETPFPTRPHDDRGELS